jgi:hypothetical protein
MLRFQISIIGSPAGDPLVASFDAAIADLAALPRMFIEPDGSFVWRGTTLAGEAWQVDGNLIDRGDVLAYVELKGCCPVERLDDVLRALGWPESPLAFQLTQRGVTLEEAEFRRLAATATGAA